MYASVALDVVIGLIFVYLLYSLLATVLSEIVATVLSLRARNMREAISRMLSDEEEKSGVQRFLNSLKLWRSVRDKTTEDFYRHPEIRYLGSSTLYPYPSGFKAVSFSKTLLNLLFGGSKPLTRERIDATINNLKTHAGPVGTETAQYIQLLWNDCYGDIEKFKLQLEAWFDRTMEQATEWYKRKVQVMLMILGFLIAWVFNVDTFVIVNKLSYDKDARAGIVNMAIAYVENNPVTPRTATTDSSGLEAFNRKLDSLLVVKRQLDKDIHAANSLLGITSWLPDKLTVTVDPQTKERTFAPQVDVAALPDNYRVWCAGTKVFSFRDKIFHFFRVLAVHFPGFLITAIAISLGAPFWFDLLTKLMRVRTSAKQKTDTESKNKDQQATPLIREG